VESSGRNTYMYFKKFLKISIHIKQVIICKINNIVNNYSYKMMLLDSNRIEIYKNLNYTSMFP